MERHNADRVQRPLRSQPAFHDHSSVDALNAMNLALLGEVMVLCDQLMPDALRQERHTTDQIMDNVSQQ